MKVKELIEILEKMDQDAIVNLRAGPIYPNSQWTEDVKVGQEACGWDGYKVVNEVFIE